MRRQPPRRRLRPSFPSSPSRSFPAIRTRPEPFFPSPLPSSRENFVFVSYSTSMIRSLRYIDFVRIAKTERLERKQGEREREGEGRRETVVSRGTGFLSNGLCTHLSAGSHVPSSRHPSGSQAINQGEQRNDL